MEIINKYQIEYIFVGEKEREYKTLNETLFKDYLEVAFTSGQTMIYKVN
jgi:uncharacterized membrane protein